jgi:hypothetical protein
LVYLLFGVDDTCIEAANGVVYLVEWFLGFPEAIGLKGFYLTCSYFDDLMLLFVVYNVCL